MLFSSPDYPLFLIAVFFLYALARWGGPRLVWARIAVMVVLADVVFVLVAKSPDALWDPIGGGLLRLVTADPDGPALAWPAWLIERYALGSALLAAAVFAGRRYAGWIGSPRGQAWIARGLVVSVAAVAAVVWLATRANALDAVTRVIADGGHLVVLGLLGLAIGASLDATHRPLGRVVMLFVASSLFYHAWAAAMPGPYRYLLALLLGTIVLDYYLAIWIERTEDPWRRKALVIVSLCSNLGILVFFKYTDFLTQDVLGLGVKRLELILPAGISFHTFQSLSYTIDVYRRQLKATRSAVQFATFVLFFPQLVAGPIVRAQDLLPQLETLPPLELDKALHGLFRIVVGLFKKIALADALALSIVDRVFEAPERFSSIEVAAGVVGYALQIYLDFSAYSDIAIGSAEVLGFTLPENFRTPYRAANLQEFWRRWHISLSTWLRDYLYITLGGSKGAPWRTYVNLIVTMLLGGLWHGASWAFIVWGALHGFGLAVTRYFQRATREGARDPRSVLGGCAAIAACGVVVHALVLTDADTWWQLLAMWLYLTPLWAALTAWLGDESSQARAAPPPTFGGISEALRLAMCACGLGFLLALSRLGSETWIPLIAATWLLGLAADYVDHGSPDVFALLIWGGRRALSVALVFGYVCLAWVFFRAESFDTALVILRRLAALETDHANLVPIVTTALVAGFMCHFWANGSFRWLRDRFIWLPSWAQGLALAAVAFALRELGHAKIVPFIYFQF